MTNDKYYIAVKIRKPSGKEYIGYYAIDSANTGGYAYFPDSIDNKDVQSFRTLEAAKRFLSNEYRIIDGKPQFYTCYYFNIIGSPMIVKRTVEVVWEMS